MSINYKTYQFLNSTQQVCPSCNQEIDLELDECDYCGANLTTLDDDYDYDSDLSDLSDFAYIHSASDWYDRNFW